METFLKWLKWVAITSISLILLIILFLFISYKNGIHKITSALPGNSQLIETSKGPVEYLIQGNGNNYVMVLHGTPGSYRTFHVEPLLEHGYAVLSPSRPGYFRTPVTNGKTMKDQADVYAALLDALNIDSVSVIGFSGGGPSAVEFAIRHPEKCSNLILMATMGDKVARKEPSLMDRFMNTEFGAWTMMGMLSTQFSNKEDAEIAKKYVHSTVFPFSSTHVGQKNDMEAFTSMPSAELEQIQSPTLIIHGTEDEAVSFKKGEEMASRIPHATLMAEEGKDHFGVVFFGFSKYMEDVIKLIEGANIGDL
jgi:2-hydroxy-6-oxonona-2,4-dienedioate hydrolase